MLRSPSTTICRLHQTLFVSYSASEEVFGAAVSDISPSTAVAIAVSAIYGVAVDEITGDVFTGNGTDNTVSRR